MPDSIPGEETLPSLREFAAAYRQRARYYLTIVFHPESGRIGERVLLEFGGSRELVVGRGMPVFDAGRPLDDPYISRRALTLRRVASGLQLSRPADASRCVAGGQELQGILSLAGEQLAAGVPLMLAHSVVLLLHSSELPAVTGGVHDCGMVGRSGVMQHLRAEVAKAAASDRDVLLRGESGTGKELVASAIHRLSRRSGEPFLAVNMAAIPPALAAASLFGSSRGAYTGAAKSQPGYFRQAEGGTLFLDEVGDTPEEVQPLLLRALQEREIQCVGGPLRRIDLRVVSATDAPLGEPGNGFRTALRHRLGAIEIEVPPLRGHAADIGELLWYFLRLAAKREGSEHVLPTARSEPQIIAGWAWIFHAFLAYAWPGNVRQLSNAAAQVLLASQQRPQLPSLLRELFHTDRGAPVATQPAEQPRSARGRKLRDIGDCEFGEAMRHCRFEVAAVAEALGVTRQSVYRRVHRCEEFRLVSQLGRAELMDAVARCDNDVRAAAAELEVSESALRSRLRNQDAGD